MPRLTLERREPRVRALVTAVLSLASVALLAIACRHAARPVLFDARLQAWASRLPSRVGGAGRWLSIVGSPEHLVVAGLVLAGLVILATRDLWWAALCLLTPPLADLAGIGVKYLTYRPGPGLSSPAAGLAGLDGASSLAFPSGHATGISARVAVVVLLVWAATNRPWIRGAATLAAILAALAVAGSQFVVGAHFPTDVAGGLLLGWAVATLAAAALLGLCRARGAGEGAAPAPTASPGGRNAWGHVISLFPARPDAAEVYPGLLIGSAPGHRQRLALVADGVSVVVDLRDEARHEEHGWPPEVTLVRAPIVDRMAPDRETLVQLSDWIAQSIGSGHRVFVHCHAGVGRSATVVCAVLLRLGWSLPDAYARLREVRPLVGPTEVQLELLTTYARNVRRG